jgi:hypothetical protein
MHTNANRLPAKDFSMNLVKTLVAAAAFVSAGASQAAVFSDNFDTYAVDQLNWTAQGGWTVTGGTVDIIGAGGGWDFFSGIGGKYVDLDGSTFQPGTLAHNVVLTGGITYVATFDLAGSQRIGYDSGNVVAVTFGTTTQSYTLATFDPFKSFSLTLTPVTSGTYALSFLNNGRDNVGALLDNVNVAAVPEPETYALMLAGLAAVGFVRRRRSAR